MWDCARSVRGGMYAVSPRIRRHRLYCRLSLSFVLSPWEKPMSFYNMMTDNFFRPSRVYHVVDKISDTYQHVFSMILLDLLLLLVCSISLQHLIPSAHSISSA